MYGHGTELVHTFEDTLRSEMECCDSVQSVQFINSTSAGCGSGLGSLLHQKVRDYCYSNVIVNFCVVPSKTVCESILEPYNFVLSKFEHEDLNFIYDNETLYNICNKT